MQLLLTDPSFNIISRLSTDDDNLTLRSKTDIVHCNVIFLFPIKSGKTAKGQPKFSYTVIYTLSFSETLHSGAHFPAI